MEKARILEEIKRTAAANGGVALGYKKFEDETGISRHAWLGKYWMRWSEALEAAGIAPNAPFGNEMFDRPAIVSRLAELTRKLGRFPILADLRMERQSDETFPSANVFKRLGDRAARISVLRAYATEHPEYADVLGMLSGNGVTPERADEQGSTDLVDGSVYMLKLGKHYKIGKTFSVPRRHNEISLELPEKPDIVHVITTDDPSGIETYWHKRFESKHTNGEWFALTRDDIRAFKRRKFM